MTELLERAAATVAADELIWRPTILDRTEPADDRRFRELFASGAVWRVYDTIEQQIADLCEIRRRKKHPEPSPAECAAILTGVPVETFGRWVHYPWSGMLVHLLPPALFHELRFDRNRKVTDAEQARLGTLTIGIAGLSAGNASANALALEGGFGHLRVADCDTLALSNMNRLRAGTDEIGLPKTTLVARQILELDPYRSLSVLPAGLDEATLADFFDGPPRLDIVIDECDDIRMKVRLREAARARGIPVLLGKLTSADVLATMTTEETVALVGPLIGIAGLSTRTAASMPEFGESLSSWPRLGSDLALGGATIAAVRRLALGEPLTSGRRYVDLDAILSADCRPAVGAPAIIAPAAARTPEVPDEVAFLVEQASRAPSGGNSQPWHFRYEDNALWVVTDRERARNAMDPWRRSALLAVGAALENVALAAAANGIAASIAPLTPGRLGGPLARIELGGERAPASPAVSRLAAAIERRRTNRRLVPAHTLPESTWDGLLAVPRAHEATVQVQTDADALAALGRIAGEVDRIRMLNPRLHRELFAEIRWSAEEAAAIGTGLELDSLELTATQAAGIRLVARGEVAAFLRAQDAGQALTTLSAQTMRAAAGVVLFSAASDDPAAVLALGRSVQRFWLEATALGLSVHPMTAAPYLFALAQTEHGAELLDSDEQAALYRLEGVFDELFPPLPGHPRLLLARVFEGPPPRVRSFRLPLAAVLHASGPSGY